jgi:quercetin dioxygenase-like cupin family protein
MSVNRKVIATTPIPILPGYENRLIRLEFPPGVEGAIHSHPVVGLGYILQGEHYSQWEGGEKEYYKAGDMFIDRALEKHVHTSNPSKTEPLVIIISYIIKIGEPNHTLL